MNEKRSRRGSAVAQRDSEPDETHAARSVWRHPLTSHRGVRLSSEAAAHWVTGRWWANPWLKPNLLTVNQRGRWFESNSGSNVYEGIQRIAEFLRTSWGSFAGEPAMCTLPAIP
jgi:hypothetical protein